MVELQEAMGGTRTEAEELAVASVRTTTQEVWDFREYLLKEMRLGWVPGRLWKLVYWLSKHWPRRWLPKLEGQGR